MKFGGKSRRIYVDRHCNSATTAYAVSGAGDPLVNGIYEKYGVMQGSDRYELVLSNGTVFTLGRAGGRGPTQDWAIARGGVILYWGAGGRDGPPEGGWAAAAHSAAPPAAVSRLAFPEVRLRARRTRVPLREGNAGTCEAGGDGGSCEDRDRDRDRGEADLLQMLHPGVGAGLGAALRQRYRHAHPAPSVTLDGLLAPGPLARALTFLRVPLVQWIGPEEGFYCCRGKYRLNFTDWPRLNNHVSGVQQLLSSPTFLSFLQALTGIQVGVPMLCCAVL
jgi:hypothetical protein